MIDAFDQQGKCLFVNRELEKTLGRTQEEIIAAEDPIALFYPDRADRDRVIESIRRADGVFREYSVLAKDGSTHIQRWADFRLPTGPNISIGHDITEHKRVEGALQESEARMSRIVESVMDSIITIDGQREIVCFNGAAEETFRCTRAQVIGKSIDRFLCEDLRKLLIDRMRDLWERKETKHYLWMPAGVNAVRADGEKFPIEATISMVKVAGRKLTTMILRDVEHREKAEEKLAKLQLETAYLRQEIKSEHGFGEIIGSSRAMKEVFQNIERVANTDTTVLLTGETGTGKELVARAIHNSSHRQDSSLIKVNCAALPSGLIESELFGHEKGAFTGALTRMKGRFELASKGTIFLDEVGAVPLETQAKLLRVLQEKEFERVGGTETLTVDVRVIAATCRDLREEIEHGGFLADLFYRLNVFPIHLAPLCERTGDITLLSDYFIRKFSRRLGKRIEGLTANAVKKLIGYDWPGNVRELANILERAVILCDSRVLHQKHIQVSRENSVSRQEISSLAQIDRKHILKALEKTSWVVGGRHGAAAYLGLKRTTLLDKMKKLGISKTSQR
jgi:PAS domain S-box-containing protein